MKVFKVVILDKYGKQKQVIVFFDKLPEDVERDLKNAKYTKRVKDYFGKDWEEKLNPSSGVAFSNSTNKAEEEFNFEIEDNNIDVEFDASKPIYVFDMAITQEDTILDLKKKLYCVSGIPIYCQHIYTKNGTIHETSYTHKINGSKYPIDESNDNVDLRDIKIDQQMVQNAGYVETKTLEMSYPMGQNTKTHYVMDLTEYMDGMDLSDKQVRSMFLNGFVKKYFPMVNETVFSNINSNDMGLSYPELSPNSNELKEIYTYQHDIMVDYRNNIQRVKKFTHDFLEFSYKSLDAKFPSPVIQQPIMKMIQDNIACDSEIPHITSELMHNGNYFSIDKTYELADLSIVNKIKSNLDIQNSVVVFFKQKHVGYVQFFDDGSYLIHMRGDHNMSSVSSIFSFYRKIIISILERAGIKHYSFKIKYSSIENIHLRIKWKKEVTTSSFLKMGEVVDEFSKGKIISHRKNFHDKHNNNQILKIDKGVERTVKKFSLRKGEEVKDYYDVYRNPEFMEIWNRRYKGCKMDIERRNGYIEFIIEGLNFRSFERSAKYILMLAMKMDEVKTHQAEINEMANVKKKMELLDPDAFSFVNKKGLKWSRICQKKMRPIGVYTQDEYEGLDDKENVHESFNYTTKLPIYYRCPKCRPQLNYIVGQHPLDYCIAKCTEGRNEGPRNVQIRKMCNTGEPVSSKDLESTGNKNIMKFGKFLQQGRSSFVHETIYDILNIRTKENLIMTNINPETYISGVEQLILCICKYTNRTREEFLDHMIKNYTEEMHRNIDIEIGYTHSQIINLLKTEMSDKMADWVKLLIKMSQKTLGINCILFVCNVTSNEEILDHHNSSVSVHMDITDDMTEMNTFGIIELRNKLYYIGSIPTKNINNLSKYVNSTMVGNKFNSYSTIKSKYNIKKVILSGNKIKYALTDKLCIGINNSYWDYSNTPISTEFDKTKFSYQETMKLLKSSGENPIFLYDGPLNATNSDEFENCIGARVGDDYFWFAPTKNIEDFGSEVRKELYVVGDVENIIMKRSKPSKKFSNSDRFFYKINIYKLYCEEIFSVFNWYRNPSCQSKIKRYIDIYKKTGMISSNLKKDFPISHEIISNQITKENLQETSYMEETWELSMLITALSLSKFIELIKKIEKQLTMVSKISGEVPTIARPMSVTAKFKTDDVGRPTSVNVKAMPNEESIFYGKLLKIEKSFAEKFAKDHHDTDLFAAKMKEKKKQIMKGYFQFKEHKNETITIRQYS